MRKKAAKTLVGMPIFGGVVMGHGNSARTLLRGVYVLGREQARQVQKLFVDSARFMGSAPPKKFRMSKGEIYYRDGRIVDVGLSGKLPPTAEEEWFDVPVMEDEEWNVSLLNEGEEWDGCPPSVYEKTEWKVLSWSMGMPDYLLVDDLRVAFSPRDLGRPYVAALSIGGPVLLRWDVASEHAALPHASADVRFIRIPQPVRKSGGGDDAAGFEAAIRYVEWLAKSAREMKALLKLLRDGGELDFIDQYRAFGHAFRPLLRQRFDESGSGDTGRLSFSMKEFGKAEVRQKLTNAVAAIARDHLVVRRGPRPGSKKTNRKPVSEERARAQKNNDEKIKKKIKKRLLTETTAAYKKLRAQFPPAEAEARLKGVVVIARLGISDRTFYNWLKRIGCKFEKLKTEALKRARD